MTPNQTPSNDMEKFSLFELETGWKNIVVYIVVRVWKGTEFLWKIFSIKKTRKIQKKLLIRFCVFGLIISKHSHPSIQSSIQLEIEECHTKAIVGSRHQYYV